MPGGTKILTFLTLLIFTQLSETLLAEQSQQSCVPSSCGHIHNISYPFRLKTDPKHFGHENYELSCCEGNHTIFTLLPVRWYGSMNYYVQAINCDNSTIRLVGSGIRNEVICSLPQHSVTIYTLPQGLAPISYKSYPSSPDIAKPITIFSCPFAINSPVFVEITNCLNRSDASNASSDLFWGHIYATMDELSASDLRVGCRVNHMSMTSCIFRNQDAKANSSILVLHNAFVYGFEVSWFRLYYENCESIYACEGENSRDVRCLNTRCKVYNF